MKLRKKASVDAPKGAVSHCRNCHRHHGRHDPCAVNIVARGGLVLRCPEGVPSKDWDRIMSATGAVKIEGTKDYVAPNRANRRANRAKRRPDGTALTRPPIHSRKAKRRKAEPNWPQKPTTRAGVSRKQISA